MQTSFFAEAAGKRQVVILVVASILIAAALAIVAIPHLAELVTGLRGAPDFASPDDLPSLSTDDTAEFLGERDQLEIRVGIDTTLRVFLDHNRLNKPYQRAQIVEQLGNAEPATRIARGTVFKLRLTPTATDVPGATTAPKGRPPQ